MNKDDISTLALVSTFFCATSCFISLHIFFIHCGFFFLATFYKIPDFLLGQWEVTSYRKQEGRSLEIRDTWAEWQSRGSSKQRTKDLKQNEQKVGTNARKGRKRNPNWDGEKPFGGSAKPASGLKRTELYATGRQSPVWKQPIPSLDRVRGQRPLTVS